MADVTEKFESLKITRGQDRILVQRIWTIDGTSNPDVAQQYGPSMDTVYYYEGEPLQVQDKAAERIGPSTCSLTVSYGTPRGLGLSGSTSLESWELDLTAGTEHVTHVRKDTLEYHKAVPQAEDVGTAIGVNGKLIEGVDRYVPKATLTITKWWSKGSITKDYVSAIQNLNSTMNRALFWGWDAGELLFIGARLYPDMQSYSKVVYSFLGSKNNIANPIPVNISGLGEQPVPKFGWEHYWVRSTQDGNPGALKTNIRSAHVAKIYEWGDFGQLNLSKGPF